MQGVAAFGCGKCMPCRLSRRRLWTHRMMLEAKKHKYSSFITLTYKDDPGELKPSDLRNWLKKIRKQEEPNKLRFYAVGEYGELGGRPHYHIALFGFPPCLYPPVRKRRKNCECPNCEIVAKTWNKGLIDNGTLTQESAQYIAGYVMKKMTRKDDPRLNGRHPEFARMSLRPGIGATALDEVVDALTSEWGPDVIQLHGDVPMSLTHGSRAMPLGRYLRSKLREKLGFPEKGTPPEKLLEWKMQMSQLFTDALKDPENRSLPLWKILTKLNSQKILNMETKANIFSKKGSL